MRDKYLHTNCLAALANMSGQFRHLHPYVSQRLVSIFETLAKKHARLQADMNGDSVEGGGSSSTSSTVAANDPTVRSMVLEDLSVLEEVLRMVLEIINSCISHQLVYCPNLVYTLLYKRQVFESFRSNPAFQDIIQNIDMVGRMRFTICFSRRLVMPYRCILFIFLGCWILLVSFTTCARSTW